MAYHANWNKYEALAEKLKIDISAGFFSDYLPGVYILAERYHANFKTIGKALNQLEKRGVVRTVRGKGRMILAPGAETKAQTVILLIATTGHLHSTFSADLAQRLQAKGYYAVPVDSDTFQGTEEEIRHIFSFNPVGLVYRDGHDGSVKFVEQHGQRFARKVAWTHFDSRLSDAAGVYSDDFQGIYRATRHLIEQGRRRLAFVLHPWIYGEARHPGSSHDRMLKGYESALKEGGLSGRGRCFIRNVEDEDNLPQLIAMLRETPETRPDGLVYYIDFLAVEGIREARRMGLRVPEDLAVIGYGNTPWTEYSDVPLSSMSIREDEIARAIVDQLTNEYQPGKTMVFEPEVIARASSGGMGGRSVCLQRGLYV